jgi:hypothetical protein
MLTSEEYEELQYLDWALEEYGNHRIDIFGYKNYVKLLEDKYKLPIKDLEEAYLKENPKA